MPTKTIIDVDVDDEKFKRFVSLFEEYSAKLDEMPESWQKIGAAMGDAGGELESGANRGKEALAIAAAQAGMISQAIRDAAKAQDDLGASTKKASEHMGGLRKNVEGVGKALSTIGGWIVKIGAIGGLGTLFSGVGFADLAGAAFARTRAAGQLGLAPGALASFQVNAQQFLGTSALEAAANAQIDITKAGSLAALGIDFQKAQRMATADLAFQELKNARAAYLQAQKQGFSPMQMPAIMAYQALGGSIGDVRNAALQPLSVIEAAQRKTRNQTGTYGFDQQTGQAWITLKTALDGASKKIETTFIRGLAPLAPEIGTLANEISDFIKSFVNSKNFGIVVTDLKIHLQSIGDFLAKTNWGELGNKFKKFELEFGVIVDKLSWLLPKQSSHPSNTKIHQDTRAYIQDFNPLASAGLSLGFGISNYVHRMAWAKDILQKIGAPLTPANLSFLGRWQAQENTAARFNPLATTQPALGASKFNSVGVRNYLSYGQGLDATAKTLVNGYYQHIVAGLKSGNPWKDKSVASELNIWGTGSGWYNAASGNWYKAKDAVAKSMFDSILRTVDEDVKKHGKSWYSHLPPDVAKMLSVAHLSKQQRASTDVSALNKTLKTVLLKRAPKPAHVSITNSTSARVAVSINAVAVS